ncbi:MAG: hypothetical protein IT581_08175 [Verrucomicrobiales bacterium]|nr:hypothetical protein [Verrucomicrobiales bacterium]
MSRTLRRTVPGLIGALSLIAAGSARAGEATYTFDTDPTGILDVVTSVNQQPWRDTGGNPGGFLALTYSQDSQYAAFAFPDIDDGKIVTAFRFEADLRVGNPEGAQGADGFAVSFARSNDPLVVEGALSNTANYAGGIPEGGSTTGIAVCFDTWAGNTLPDGADIEGIIVRVDNATILRQSLPTRNGACDDATSLQTGLRDPDFWANSPDAYDPSAWDTLCWQKLIVDLSADGKLTVSWKGRTILDKFQTAYFPTPGQIILSGRTGGENENTHFDNIKLTTTATAVDTQKPTTPPNLAVASSGTRRVLLTWGAATDDSGRVAYKVVRNGATLANLLTTLQYEDLNVFPGKTYDYQVLATDVSGNESVAATVSATTGNDVTVVGWLVGEIYDGISGTLLDDLLASEKYPNSPDRTRYLNGLSFGFGGASGPEFGDNYGIRIAGVLTAPESGQYRFFVRSDDSSRFYLNTSGATIPDTASASPIAEESDCCEGFVEPGVANDDGSTYATSEPVTLTAGQNYGFVYLVKEGGGGDNGEVAWRKEGDTTPASSLVPLRGGLFVSGKGDALGSSVTIATQPANATVVAYKPATFTAAATATSLYTTNIAYQWYKNGIAIPGANSPSYTLAVPQPADNGAKFKLLASVPGAQATSSEATLTVTDSQAPAISTIEASESFTEATVKFDQPVTAASAAVAGNYKLDQGLTVSAAVVVDTFTVRLTTSRQTDNAKYSLTVNGVQNLGGKGNVNATGTLQAWTLVSGRARMDQFNDIGGGTAVADLLGNEKYPNSPDVVRYLPGMTFGEGTSFGNTYGDNYGAAVKAVLKPTETGAYRFFIRSDDASNFYLNTSGATIPDPASVSPIAQETDCCEGFLEPGVANDDGSTYATSEPVTLTAGQSYGILLLVKEGGGGDWGQVAWRKEGDTTAAGSLQALKNNVYWYGPPAAVSLSIGGITSQGGNVIVTYVSGILQSADAVTGPYTDVAGATSPYTTPHAGSQKYYRLRGN